jgi:hypothetical protein
LYVCNNPPDVFLEVLTTAVELRRIKIINRRIIYRGLFEQELYGLLRETTSIEDSPSTPKVLLRSSNLNNDFNSGSHKMLVVSGSKDNHVCINRYFDRGFCY